MNRLAILILLLFAGCSSSYDPLVLDVLRSTNEARFAGHSCQAYPAVPQFSIFRAYPAGSGLAMDARLTANAQAHAEYVAETVDLNTLLLEHHQSMEAIAAAGGMSENIAQIGPIVMTDQNGNQTTRPEPDEDVGSRLVSSWLRSPGHCHNLMQPQWTHVGIGVALSEGGRHYGVQVFR